MKQFIFFITITLFISCGKDKVVLLPEIDHSEISEITDVSAAYIFYDETQPDSTELNRRNLISTTNWLINVDKRLTLKQVIPHIKFLQEKKGNSSHKNEKAKNYFTCNDTSKKTLGFIEFTNVVYQKASIINLLAEETEKQDNTLIIHCISPEDIKINSFFEKVSISHSNISKLINDIKSLSFNKNYDINMRLFFNENFSFQDYISVKSELDTLQTETINVDLIEYILN